MIGLALCVLAVKLLEIFDVEAKQREEALDRARAIAEERSRFGRDLHDGTIQSIYAAGLHLEAVAIRCDDPLVRREVREVVADLNAATDGIRDYIRDLNARRRRTASPPASASSTRRFADETGRDVRFAVERPALRPAARRGRPAPGADPAGGAVQHRPPRRPLQGARDARTGPDELDLWSPTTGAARNAAMTDEGCGTGPAQHARARAASADASSSAGPRRRHPRDPRRPARQRGARARRHTIPRVAFPRCARRPPSPATPSAC